MRARSPSADHSRLLDRLVPLPDHPWPLTEGGCTYYFNRDLADLNAAELVHEAAWLSLRLRLDPDPDPWLWERQAAIRRAREAVRP